MDFLRRFYGRIHLVGAAVVIFGIFSASPKQLQTHIVR